MTISVNIGKGLKFTADHGITTDVYALNELIRKYDDGLYVPNLSGNDGGLGGTSVDSLTIIEDSSNKPKLNVDYVQCIYSMGYRVVDSRSAHALTYSSTLKTITSIVSEMNYYAYADYTSYYFRKGDLFQLVTFSIGSRPYGYSGGYMEESNRYISNGEGNNETKVLFVVDEAKYKGHKCIKLVLTCLYTKADETSNFTKGQVYSFG